MHTRHYLQTLLRYKVLPAGIILFSLVFVASLSFAFSSQETYTRAEKAQNEQSSHEVKKIVQPTAVTPSPTKSFTSTAQIIPHVTSLPTRSGSTFPTTSTSDAKATPQQQSLQTQMQTVQPTATPGQQQVSTTIAPTQAVSTAMVEIKDPSNSSNFSIELTEGMNVCDVLQKAKDTGKIASVTFDDSYLASFNSRYVVEINGYQNNWTFTVNGSGPLGCSLAHPKPNDTIVWKFG